MLFSTPCVPSSHLYELRGPRTGTLGCKFTNDCFATVNQKVIENKTQKRGLGTRSAVATTCCNELASDETPAKILNALSTKC